MKKLYFLLFTFLIAAQSFGQGSESFANSNATTSYADNSFVGDGGVTWSYVQSRDANNDANGSGINLPALMLRRLSSGSKVTSSVVSGGIGDFSVKLYKGFTGANNRQVELYVNNVLVGTSVAFDDFLEHIFTVTGVNVGGDVVIELRNVTEGQIIVDDISWTGFAGAGPPGLVVNSPSDMSKIAAGTTSVNFSITTQNFDVANGTGDGHIHWTVDSGSGPVDQGEKYDTADEPISVTDGQTYTIYMEFVDNSETVLDPPVNKTIFFTVSNPPQSLPLSEDFDYTVGAKLSFLPDWNSFSGTYNQIEIVSGSLSMVGYPSSGVGASVTITGSNDEDVNSFFTEQTTGTVYMSALINISAVGSGNYFMHLKDGASNFRARVGAKDDGFGKILFGIGTTSSTLTYGTTPFDLNTTYLIVASFNIDSGLTNLHVLTSVPGTEPVTPEATETGGSGIAISSVSLRQSGSIPTVTIDGIRVGTTWSSAVLSTNTKQIEGFSFSPNPTSLGYINISSKNQTAMKVNVYDILGKQVINTTVSNNRLDVSNLTTGIYIMKISQDDATTTKKLVIK